jgi:hypothetical protein
VEFRTNGRFSEMPTTNCNFSIFHFSFRVFILPVFMLMVFASKPGHTQTLEDGLPDLAEQSVEQILDNIQAKHPLNYIVLAMKLFSQGEADQAVKWFYVAQIRYRAHLKARPELEPSGDPALFGSMMAVVGPPINQYAARDSDHWAVLIDEAVEWHNTHDDLFLDKASYQEVYQEVLGGLEALRLEILNRDRSG